MLSLLLLHCTGDRDVAFGFSGGAFASRENRLLRLLQPSRPPAARRQHKQMDLRPAAESREKALTDHVGLVGAQRGGVLKCQRDRKVADRRAARKRDRGGGPRGRRAERRGRERRLCGVVWGRWVGGRCVVCRA